MKETERESSLSRIRAYYVRETEGILLSARHK